MLGRTLHLPALSCRDSVWANPFSLAATNGISIDFSSCWYSDVSFPSVRAPFGAPKRLRNFGYWSQGRICWAEHYISRPFREGIRFGLSRFRSPLLAGSQLISLPAGTQMFPSPAFARLSAHRSACAALVDYTPFGHLRIVDCMHLP
jgi:hypothetical protein